MGIFAEKCLQSNFCRESMLIHLQQIWECWVHLHMIMQQQELGTEHWYIHWNRMKISKCITAQLKSSNKSLLLASFYFWELWVTEQIKSDSFAASWWSVQEQLKSGEKLCLPLHRRFSGIIWHSFGKHFTWNGLAIENSQHVCYCFFCHHTDGLDCGRSNVRGYDDIIQV